MFSPNWEHFPIVTPVTQQHFLHDENNRLVGMGAHDIDGSKIITAALPVNQSFNLIELTNRDSLLASGLIETSDHILELNLKSLYVRDRGQVVEYRLTPHDIQRMFWLFPDQRQIQVRIKGTSFHTELNIVSGEFEVVVPRYERRILGVTLSVQRGAPLASQS